MGQGGAGAKRPTNEQMALIVAASRDFHDTIKAWQERSHLPHYADVAVGYVTEVIFAVERR